MNKNERVTVGLVGAGAVTRRVHLPVLKNIPQAEIAWIADLDGSTARETAAAFSLPRAIVGAEPEAMPACDFALLAVPIHTREPYLRHFSGRGTALLAEKPFAITAQDHQRYLDLFGSTPISCGFMRRTYANVRALRRIVRGGWFGELRAIGYAEGGRVTSSEAGSATLDLSHRLGGGVLRDLGCHGIDVIGYITSATEFGVHACEIAWDAETDRHVDARFMVVGGHTPRGCPVRYTVSWLHDQANTIELEFERATVRCGIKPEAVPSIAGRTEGEAIETDFREAGARTPYQSFFLQWDTVLNAFAAGGDCAFSAATSLWTTRVVEALYLEARTP